MLCSLLLLLLLLLCFNIMISICIKYYLKESYTVIKLSFTSWREVLHVCNGLYLECLLYICYLVCMWWSGSVCLILVCADWHLHFCRCGIMGNFESETRGMEVGESQIFNLQALKLC